MALCGEKHISNVATPNRPTQANGMMVWDTTVQELMVSCGGVWNKAAGPAPIPPPNIPTCWAAVAGGGAGGTGNGAGGGGAGGAILGSTDFSENTWYCVSVGAGGAVAPGFFNASNPGSDTCFAGSLALGGGNGGGHPGLNGVNGGSGGGGSQVGATCGCGTPGQGCHGGRGTGQGISTQEYGGGGGGKCANGVDAPPGAANSGSGGIGFCLDNQPSFPAFSAGNGTLAGGGGAGSGSPGNSGTGSSGGGNGGCNGGAPARSSGTNAAGNSGSGGGGGPGDTSPFGGNGGSGVIILFHDAFYCIVRSTPTISVTTAPVSNGCAGTYITGGSGCICFITCP